MLAAGRKIALIGLGIICVWSFCPIATCPAAEIILKDGRRLVGKPGKVAGLAEVPKPITDTGANIQNILLMDDDLRRTFVSDRLVREVVQDENRELEEKFNVHQRYRRSGHPVSSVGIPLKVDPFDEYGRRIFSIHTNQGVVDIIQGITVLTPRWAKVEGITHLWDMRLATSNIPRDTLHKILLHQIDPKNIDHYKKLARFYIQAERYEEARQALDDMLKAFPDRKELKEELAPSMRAIQQLSARRLANELRMYRDAGQYRFAWNYLQKFPSEGVGGDVLQGVREMIRDHETIVRRYEEIVKQLKSLTARMKDTVAKENLQPILDEMTDELSAVTLDRMAAFMQNADDAKMPDKEKVALAISGWLMGADGATEKLAVALSAFKVRNWIREYITETLGPERERIFSYIKQEPAGKPEMVAKLLAHMKPPIPLPEYNAETPGFYKLEVPGLTEEQPITYYVQLPPEYDPYRRYPTIVTLNGAAGTPEGQINWWAGEWIEGSGRRSGQATRHGYIVIAPDWTVEHQKKYGYSAREHATVLYTLRDACRRFSIDTDKVFLSGNSLGGDAAWDIGLAHPDLWAGVIPICARSDKYCNQYWENARYVPFYVIDGELDGKKMVENALDLDRYLRRGFDTTVVEYIGRGEGDFSDEIHRLFDWMARYRRNFFPRKFKCISMRSWDNFFWWVEIDGLPPRSDVPPVNWPKRGAQPTQIRGTLNQANGINVRAGASRVSVWLSPEMIDFKHRSIITVNGRRFNPPDQIITPDLHVMLDDVRTRGDRQHPFWAKLEGSSGRAYGN